MSAEWTADEQKALELAMARFPASVGAERWDMVAGAVPGKTKADCLKRARDIITVLKEKKAAAAASKAAAKAPASTSTSPPHVSTCARVRSCARTSSRTDYGISVPMRASAPYTRSRADFG